MFVNPNLSGQLARDCHRELLTRAEQRRLSRQLRATSGHRTPRHGHGRRHPAAPRRPHPDPRRAHPPGLADPYRTERGAR